MDPPKQQPATEKSTELNPVAPETNVSETQPTSTDKGKEPAETVTAEQPPAQGNRRSRRTRKPTTDSFAMAAEPKESKPKLSPPCAECRQSKTRCTHRSIMTDESAQAPKKRKRTPAVETLMARGAGAGDADGKGSASAEPLAKKARARVRKEREDESQGEEEKNKGTGSSQSLPPDPKRATTQRERSVRGELGKGNQGDCAESESTASITKSATDASKSARRQGENTQDAAAGASTTVTAGQTDKRGDTSAPGRTRSFPPFPADALRGSTHLAIHKVYSKKLGEKLEDCEKKWRDAIDALYAVKKDLDTWMDVWEKGG